MRYFVHIAYNGAKYNGWQKQPYAPNVQGVLETVLTRILKTPVAIVGCGRTDAHVHASQFFFHMDVERTWDFDLVFRLNKSLPTGISVFDVMPMAGQPHARFDAVLRSYDYFIHTCKSPFLDGLSAYYAVENLDFESMAQAASLLTGYDDFRPFCTSPEKYEHTLCNILSARMTRNAKGDMLRFHITANRFLSKMIRIIVGQLLKIGKGELSIDTFEKYLIHRETPELITPAHPEGLYLSKVSYRYLNLPPQSEFPILMNGGLEEFIAADIQKNRRDRKGQTKPNQ